MILKWATDWWRRRSPRRARIGRVRRFASRAEVPRDGSRRQVALVQSGEIQKWALFWCPCGRGHRIELNLDSSHSPHWRLHLDGRGRPSISPSVDVRDAWGCHFWLTDGRVRWCPWYRTL